MLIWLMAYRYINVDLTDSAVSFLFLTQCDFIGQNFFVKFAPEHFKLI